MITTAFVKIWKETVGAVAWNTETGVGSFEYDAQFLAKNWELAPLKMPTSTAKGRIFSFSELKEVKTFKGLPGLLADVLPAADCRLQSADFRLQLGV
jgi:serine/threonine-protein kinase HipA